MTNQEISCLVDFQVEDKTPPSLTCDQNVKINVNEMCLATYTWAPMDLTDNCGTDYNETSEMEYSLGTFTETFNVTDDYGNFVRNFFVVIVTYMSR